MTQENVSLNNQEAANAVNSEGFIAAENSTENTEADLSVCAVDDLSFEAEDIKDIKLENDTLVITLKDGSDVTIENFKTVMAATGISELKLADGTIVDLSEYSLETAAADEGETEGDIAVATTQTDNEEEQADAVNAPAEDTLETVIAEGVQETDSIADQVIANIEPAAGEEAQEVAAIEPASGDQNLAQLATQLAEVEPAAGDAGTPGASGRGGFGFDSNTDAISIAALPAIGPINPTALQYGIGSQDQEQLFIVDPLLPPTLTVNNNIDDAIVKEDGSIFVPITANLQGPDIASQILTITISGVDAATAASGGFLPTAVPGVYAQTLPAGTNFNGGITVTPAAQTDLDLGQFSVIATSENPNTGEIESVSDDATVITDAVADVPEVDGVDGSTFVDNAQDVNITGGLGDDKDGSEEITSYTITSTTDLSGFTFSAGIYNPATNTLTLDPADVAGLQITPPTDFVGSVDLEVTIFNEETTLTDTEVDATDNTNSASDIFTITWVKGPVIEYKFSNEVDGDTGLVKEDSSVELDLSVDNVDNVGPVDGDEVLTVTISGIDAGWGVVLPGQSGVEWVETSPGTFAITLPAGESYDGTLTFTPPADSDLDHPTFTITADVFDPELGLTASDSATGDILTDAVIDAPTLNVTAASGEEGTTIPLDISAAIGETADYISETITNITISGLPEGATLNNGEFDPDTGVWTLEVADLTDLEVTIPDGTSGDFPLSVSVTSEENVAEGDEGNGEVDFTDNTATITKILKLNVEKDTDPTAQPTPVTVNESNLPGTLTQTGDLNIDFGGDEEGSTVEVKSDVVPEGLTSAGQDVTVIGEGKVYTGTNEDDVTVFTFTINDDGTYTYEQFLPLDHAEGEATDDTLPIEFCVKITDGDGDEIDASVIVNVLDDNPIANDDDKTVEESEGSVSGNIVTNDDGGSDVTATVTEVTFEGEAFAVPTDGTNIVIEGEYGTLTINNLGEYTYEITVSNPPAGSEVFGYTLTDFDGDTDTAVLTITLNIINDQPILKITDTNVNETNFDLGNLSQTGTITADFGADGPGTLETNGSGPTGLTSAGQDVTVTSTDNGYEGQNEDGETVFTLTLNGDGTYSYVQELPLDHAEGTSNDDAIELTFGVVATDDDGEQTPGEIIVTVKDDNPVANDDTNAFDSNTGSTSGNVITGDNGPFDTTSSDTDNLSNDVGNVITQIQFGENDPVEVPTEGVAVIEGEYGTLEISADGSYTYTLFDGVEPTGKEECDVFTPTAADVEGEQQSLTLNDITISIGEPRPGSSIDNGGDLKWLNTSDGSGIGVGDNGSRDNKVWPRGEVLNVDPAKDATSIDITLSELSDNNAGNPLTVEVFFTDGSMDTLTYIVPNPAPADGLWTVSVEGGDKQIDNVNLFNEPGDGAVSFLLNEVKAFFPGETKLTDEFDYTLQDFDGDTSTATLEICAEDLIDDQPEITVTDVLVDETNFNGGDLTQIGTITANFGADGPGTLKTNGSSPVGLMSAGQLVTITSTDTGYEGQNEDGATVFTLTLNGDGTYTYVQELPLDHPNATDPDDAIELTFGVVATDENGDQTPGEIVVTVKDDGPVAKDDTNNSDTDTATGNVITGLNGGPGAADDLSEDVQNTITEVNGQPVSSEGITTINGTNGTLEIDALGNYTYTATAAPESQTIYCFSATDPNAADPAGNAAGDIGQIDMEFNDVTNEFTFSMKVEETADGFTVVVNDGANPKSTGAELAIVYFDASGDTPVITTYAYSGSNNHRSYYDGSSEPGDQPADKLVSSLNNPELFSNISVTTDGEGNKIMSFTVDATSINSHDPLYGESSDWEGLALGNQAGIWLHPTSGLNTEYGEDGFLSSWSDTETGYYDAGFLEVETKHVCPEPVSDEFTYTLKDQDGDTSTATLSLTVDTDNDNKPVISGNKNMLDETDGLTGTVEGTISVDYGIDEGDGKGVLTNNSFTATGSTGDALTHNGEKINVKMYGGFYVGRTETSNTLVFKMKISTDGTYKFELFEPLDHADAHDPDDVITLNFGIAVTDHDCDTTVSSISIDVKDDGPSANNKAGRVYEKDLRDGGEIVIMRDVKNLDFGTDGAGKVEPGRFIAKHQMGGPGVTLQSGGVDIDVKIIGNSFIGKAGEKVIFTLEVNPETGKQTYTQYEELDHQDGNNPDDVIWLKFYLNVVDNDGDSVEVLSMFDVHDDAPIAEDDSDVVEAGETSTSGNVVLNNDEKGADLDGNVKQISFGDEDPVDIPQDGSNAIIHGEFGVLKINQFGDYTYDLVDDAFGKETTYTFVKDLPGGSDAAGDIKNVTTSYTEETNELCFELTVESSANGFTVALNDGPNPKGHGGELALLYFDASGDEPVISVYSYNGKNTQTSWTDGSAADGNQPADRILNSIANADLFSNIVVTTDEHGNHVFSFKMDASTIQSHDPEYGVEGDWSGISFDESIGIWLHPVSGLETSYDEEGFLTSWNPVKQSWYDTSNQHAEMTMTQDALVQDEFEYVLVDNDGDSDSATLSITSYAPGTNVVDVSGDDTTIYATEAVDVFLFETETISNDNEIKGYDSEEDVLDLSALVAIDDADTLAIADFVKLTEVGDDTVVSVDVDGAAGPADFENVVTLRDATGLDLETLSNEGNLVA